MPVLGVERRGCLGGGELGGSEPVGKLGSARERARVVNMFGLQRGKTPDGPRRVGVHYHAETPLDIPHRQAALPHTAGPAPADAVGAVDGSRNSSLH